MKNIIKYSFPLVLLISFVAGCKKLDKVNTDPNDPSNVSPSVQLTATELQIGYAFGGDIARYVGVIDQHAVGNDRQMALTESYIFSPSDFDLAWQNNYLSMNNLKDLAAKSESKGYNEYVGIAKVLTAYILGMSSDLWGNIPYKEALKDFSNLTPAYDPQQDVYASVQSLLDEGIAAFGKAPGAIVPGADDIVYGGDETEWTKLAYALKARFYLHIRKQDPSAIAKAQAALANAFTASSDDAYFHFGSTKTSGNPWYQFFIERGSDIVFFVPNGSDTLGTVAKIMVETNDPRLPYFIDTSSNGLGSFYAPAQAGVQIMTYAEQKFIEAELASVSGDNAAAAAAANAGAIESVTAITGSAPDATWTTAYASETAGTITLEKIMTQKYLALFLNPESWTDWRRTGFPVLSPNPGAVISGIPRRLLYSEYELERNTNTPTGVQVTDKVWWDI
jgi:hypothetical protein